MVSGLSIVNDVLLQGIGKELSLPDFVALAGVCRTWRDAIQPKIEDKLLEKASFGIDQWLMIPGVSDVGEKIGLTTAQKIEVIAKLKGKCEFFNELDPRCPHRFENDKIKRRWQTQKLIFFPETISGKPRTMNSQNKLFHFIKEVDDGTACYRWLGSEEEAYRNQPAPKSYWALVTMDIVPGSREIALEQKQSLLKPKGYKVLTPNDAITSILLMNLGPSKEKKGYFFGTEGLYLTYTVTKLDYTYRLYVGAAAPSGLIVERYPIYDDSHNFNIGVAGALEVP